MLFSSVIFVFAFLPLVLIGHSLLSFFIGKHKGVAISNIFLFAMSILFYAWGEPEHVFVLMWCTISTFFVGLLLGKNPNKTYLGIGIGLNLALLIYFKYANLFYGVYTSTQCSFFPFLDDLEDTLKIALPLGISFYTFQSISYLIDVYRKETTASRNLVEFGCYLTMFPQLIAGPIVRYANICRELRRRVIDYDQFTSGASRFIMGLAKKVLIADILGKVAEAAFTAPAEELSASGAWLGIICYTFQIYYDFSGYSDMAIGIGRMLGFTFPENFNYPYIANSIQDFWRRWHMSLSTWFRDYLYIPLGGSRRGEFRLYVNLLIVFSLCGFWHGASWNFLAWGTYFGLFLIFERLIQTIMPKIPMPFRHIYVLGVVVTGWVLFNANDFAHALSYYKALLGFYDGGPHMGKIWMAWHGNAAKIAMILAVICSFPLHSWLSKKTQRINTANAKLAFFFRWIQQLSLLTLLIICFYPIFGQTYSPFIYFRF